MFMLRGMSLAIHPETNFYFVTKLLPEGEALRDPLPASRVDLEIFRRHQCGGVPLIEGFINIASVTDLEERCALEMIVRLAR